MFNYVTVDFPTVDVSVTPDKLMSFSMHQNRYAHEICTITYRDSDVDPTAIQSGYPVHVTLYNGTTPSPVRNFYGYVHHIKPIRTPSKNYIEMTFISASWVMKNETQTIYKDMSADGIVQTIAKKYNFACYTVPHPRIYPQVLQTGISDWGLMVRLAKQCGYSLRTESTELYFEPVLDEYTKYRSQAPTYTMRDFYEPGSYDMYSFEPLIGENLPLDEEAKSAPAISGLDKNTITPIAHTRPTRNKKTSVNYQFEFFDRFDTHVVADTLSTAQYEAQAAEDRASFPYRAKMEVMGDHTLHPNMPVYTKGVGPQYDTFWVVLDTEHKIVESARHMFIYSTILTLGTDSLGTPTVWSDNQQIVAPTTVPTRTIFPGVTQTAILPQSKLLNSSLQNIPQLAGSFGTLKNRAGSLYPAPVWATATATLNPILTPVGSQAVVLTPSTLIGTAI